MSRVNLPERFSIQKEIGRGGMGVVFQAHDQQLKRDVAIKVIHTELLSETSQARMLREAQLAASLNHPNIVTIFDVGQIETWAYIVMEFLPGGTLADNPPISINETLLYASQICAALEQAHAQGIVHRDLKPENILFGLGGKLKLSDFGVARSLASRMTEEGNLVGTAFYMPPEQALGAQVDGRSDLYSFGVMLYEMCTGTLPFEGDDALTVITQHLHAPVVHPRVKNNEIPELLDQLIIQLLAKDPDKRPFEANEVQTRLNTLLDQVDGQSESFDAHPGLAHVVRGRLVARETELQQARQLWQDTRNNKGKLLLVSGEPGVGKTRFVQELMTQARVSGGQAWIGEWYSEGNAPYAGFAQIIQQGLKRILVLQEAVPELVLSDLLTLVPELRVDFPGIKSNPPLDPEAEQRRLFENIVRFLYLASEHQPVLIVLEDLHWADGGSLHLLRHLARRTISMKVMLVGTYREIEITGGSHLHTILYDLIRDRLGQRINLKRLNLGDTEKLLGVLFSEEITPEFLSGIYAESEGNPFFVEEICKSLIESGAIKFEGGIWHRPVMERLTIPQSILYAIQERVSRLSHSAQRALQNAAIVGRQFNFAILQELTEFGEEDLIDSLETALQAQLVEEIREPIGEVFRFSHALIPAALRENLSGMRQSRIHRKVGQAYERLQPENLEKLAFHWGQGGVEEKALSYTIKAAKRAQEVYANEQAVYLYTEALEMIPKGEGRRFALLKERGTLFGLTGSRDAQEQDINELLVLADILEDQEKKVDALLALAEFYLLTDLSRVEEIAKEAQELSRALKDIEREAWAVYLLARRSHVMFIRLEAYELFFEAIQLFKTVGNTEKLIQCLLEFSLTCIHVDAREQGLEAASEAMQLSKEIGNKMLEGRAARMMGASSDDEYMGIELTTRSVDIAHRVGDLFGESRALNNLGVMKIESGQLNEAEEHYLAGLEILEAIGLTTPIQNPFAYNLSSLYIFGTRNHEKTDLFLKNLLERTKTFDDPWLTARLEYQQLVNFSQIGLIKEGLELLESESGLLVKVKALPSMKNAVLSLAGEFYTRFGDQENGLRFYKIAWDDPSYEERLEEPESLTRVSLLLNDKKLIMDCIELYRSLQATYPRRFSPIYMGRFLANKAELQLALAEPGSQLAEEVLVLLEGVFQLASESHYFYKFPEQIHFFYSKALRLNGRDAESDDYLRRAYTKLMKVANAQSPVYREAFLNNLAENQVILREYSSRFSSG